MRDTIQTTPRTTGEITAAERAAEQDEVLREVCDSIRDSNWVVLLALSAGMSPHPRSA